MKKIKILFTGLLLSGAFWAQGQNPEADSAPELNAAPPALIGNTPKPESPADKPALPAFSRKPQFSMSLGSQFSRFGQASYLQPTVSLPVTRRFQAFASMQFISTYGPAFYRAGYEGANFGATTSRQQSYLVMAGGQYAVNEKWNLTGSIWRDISQLKGMNQPTNLFSPAGSQGMMLRAHYKVNDRFSVSGGVRYGSGGYNPYSPISGQSYPMPFGY